MNSAQKLFIATGIVAVTLGSTWYLCHRTELAKSINHPMSESSASAPQNPQGNASKGRVSTESFEILAEQSLQNLPKKADLRKLTAEEAHHTPALLMKAAGELGDVAEALQAKLKQSEGNAAETEKTLQEGVSFYQKCLSQNESPESVRALCYSHYRELREKLGQPESQEEARTVPLSVRSLADFLANR